MIKKNEAVIMSWYRKSGNKFCISEPLSTSDDMKTFFTKSEEGVHLYKVLQRRIRTAWKHTARNGRLRVKSELICSLMRKMDDVLLENAGMVVSRPST